MSLVSELVCRSFLQVFLLAATVISCTSRLFLTQSSLLLFRSLLSLFLSLRAPLISFVSTCFFWLPRLSSVLLPQLLPSSPTPAIRTSSCSPAPLSPPLSFPPRAWWRKVRFPERTPVRFPDVGYHLSLQPPLPLECPAPLNLDW